MGTVLRTSPTRRSTMRQPQPCFCQVTEISRMRGEIRNVRGRPAFGIVLILFGCPEGGGEDGGTAETYGDETLDVTSDDTSQTSTSAETTGTGGDDVVCPTNPPGGYTVYPQPDDADGQGLSRIDITENDLNDPTHPCFDLGPDLSVSGPFSALIRRPFDPAGVDDNWPMSRLPFLVFSHGNGAQDGQYYEHLWERLVPEGFVVATVAGNEPASP